MAAFTQFEGELDDETKKLLNRGAKVTQILKQKKGQPMSLSEEVAIIWTATNGYLDEVDNEKISLFEEKLLETIKVKGKKWSSRVEKSKELKDEDVKELEKFVKLITV